MQDPIKLFRFEQAGRDLLSHGLEMDTPLRGLSMLAIFGGHFDAGNLSSQVRSTLLDNLDHELIATFDADQLIDYRSRRPHIKFDGERFLDFQSPTLQMHLMTDALGSPFLLLSGPEPDYQWERFVAAILTLVERLDVKLVTLVDAIPLPVPHTRPLGVTAHGNREELVEGLSTWSPQARMLAGVGQLLEVRLQDASRDTTGYTLHVPHYLADASYPQAAVAALEYVGAAMGLMLPTDELRERGRDVDLELDRQTRSSEEISMMVEGLERNFDQHAAEQGEIRSLLLNPDQQVPDAEQLGAAVEDYLSTRPRHAAKAGFKPLMPSRPQTEPPFPGNAVTEDEPEADEQGPGPSLPTTEGHQDEHHDEKDDG